MSNESSASCVNIKKIPRFILRKDKLTNLTILKPCGNNELLKKLKNITKPLYKEDVIYQSVSGDFLKLSDTNVTIVNKQNVLTNTSVTVARYETGGRVYKEITSDSVTNLIGKENYDLVFSTLCSVFSQEFKIRAILSLLTPKSSDLSKCEVKKTVLVDVAVQTEESSFDVMMKARPRRRVKRQHPTPYVVTDIPGKLNRVVVNPNDFSKFTSDDVPLNMEKVDKIKTELEPCTNVVESPADSSTELPDIHLDEDSRGSFGGISGLTDLIPDEFIKAPLSLIDKVTMKQTPQPEWVNTTRLVLLDQTVIDLPVKPEDVFHIATAEILRSVQPEYRSKLLCYQLYMDWKYCLTPDEDNYLALHTAVVNGDVDLVRRQCLVLKSRDQSVDIPTGDNQSALQLSILHGSPACTETLLRLGADPLVADDDYRTCVHLAAEGEAPHLAALLEHCRRRPRQILEEAEELWKPELASKPDEYLVDYLLHGICSMTDSQGETPLTLASRLGRHENVSQLVLAAPRTVNLAAGSSGNTPLYHAVTAACHDAANRGNKSKVPDEFRRTIEILVDNGADPAIANHSGIDVNSLLSDLTVGDLPQLIAGKMSYMNTRDTGNGTHKPLMLIKKEDGTVNAVDLQEKKVKRPTNVNTKPKASSSNSSLAKKVFENVKNTPKDVKNTANDVKNTTKDVKNTSKDIKNTNKDIKNTAKGKQSVANTRKASVAKRMKDAIASVEHNIDMIESGQGVNTVTKNTVMANTNEVKNVDLKTSNVGTPTSNMGSKKLIIIENKVIKHVNDTTNVNSVPELKSQSEPKSNAFMNHFKNFVDSRNILQQNTSFKQRVLKRKSDVPVTNSIIDNVRDISNSTHQTICKISSVKSEKDVGNSKFIEFEVSPKKSLKYEPNLSSSKIVVIETKACNSKKS